MHKRNFIPALSLVLLLLVAFHYPGQAQQKPNIIFFLVDDVGYGDLSLYGNPNIRTPHIDSLAYSGLRFTSMEAAPWCVPSRAELMTGRYMARTNFNGGTGAGGHGGIPDTILTLAQSLKDAGYSTAMVGKWHLGYDPKKYLPTNRGFDSWLGLPYSNDYKLPYVNTDVPLVMYRDTNVVEYPVNQDSLTVKYTWEAVRFVRSMERKEAPFFLYFAYNAAHLPLHTTTEFYGKSGAGLRGDVIQTIDWSVGEVLHALKEAGLDKNTIVYFGSDNGPWENAPDRMFRPLKEREGTNDKIWERGGNKPWDAGSSGVLRGYKHTTYEGGPRVPAMISWPGHIKPGRISNGLITHMDLYTTFIKAAKGELPHYKIDGMNMLPFLTGKEKQSPRKEYGYFINNLQGIRVGEWKLRDVGGHAQLFNMQYDPEEKYNQAKDHPEIVQRLKSRMIELARDVGKSVEFMYFK